MRKKGIIDGLKKVFHFTRKGQTTMFDNIIHADSYDFFDRSGSGLVLAFFYEHEDHQCRMMEQIIDELASIYCEDDLLILAVDTEQSPDLAAHYGIDSIPMVLIMKDGRIIEAVEGMNPASVYSNILNYML